MSEGEVAPYVSPLLDLPGAVPPPAGSADPGIAWHHGDPLGEQRSATADLVVVDRSDRPVVALRGDERLSWLHSITSQHVEALPDGASAENLVLDMNGHVEAHFVLTDRAGVTWIDTEPGSGDALLSYLQKMVFWAKVEPARSDELAVLSLIGPRLADPAALAAAGIPELPISHYATAPLDGGGFARRMPWPDAGRVDLLVPRAELRAWWDRLRAAGAAAAGSWAFDALRVAGKHPRFGVDSDERALPHELDWIGGVEDDGAVHLDKGCYRGQETVARVHNLGRPPRRLVVLHLDGSADALPEPGDAVTAKGRTLGRVGTVTTHHELGPIALALIKRNIPVDAELVAGSSAAAIDADSFVSDDAVPAGRAAVDRLRGR